MLPLHPQHTPLSCSPLPKKPELTERLDGRCYEFSNKPARLCTIMSGTFPWSLFLSASSLLPCDHIFRICKRTPRWTFLRAWGRVFQFYVILSFRSVCALQMVRWPSWNNLFQTGGVLARFNVRLLLRSEHSQGEGCVIWWSVPEDQCLARFLWGSRVGQSMGFAQDVC